MNWIEFPSKNIFIIIMIIIIITIKRHEMQSK